MIKEQYKENTFDESFLLMLILGRKDFYFGVFEGKSLIQLEVK